MFFGLLLDSVIESQTFYNRRLQPHNERSIALQFCTIDRLNFVINKAQQSTERGFRFLKDPLFFTSSVFLKTPQRVTALAMLMGLCLLVYNLGQRALRQALDSAKQTIGNQVGKPTAKHDITPILSFAFGSNL
jgi:transposase